MGLFDNIKKYVSNISYDFAKGYAYYHEKDYEEAFFWFKKAADQNHANACEWCGHCYENGYGTEKDYTKAVSYYNKAINLGNIDAMFDLGTCYYYGHGVNKDYRIAFSWLKKGC